MRARVLTILVIFAWLLTSWPTMPSRAAGGNFLSISGDQFVYGGQAVKLKGVNYYPRLTPWATMFDYWQGASVDADMARLRAIGANVVRVMIPYGADFDWTDENGAVDSDRLAYLRQLVQAAGKYGLKVNLTLFDFYNGAPGAGSDEEGRNLTYLTQLAKAFRDDDRIFAWDLHNEPDNYALWTGRNRPDLVVDWLRRMTEALRTLDPNHPITVGFGNYMNYWQKGPNNVRPVEFVDFIALHSYDAGNITSQIRDIKGRSAKPILLQETGWPTGPTCNAFDYSEGTQVRLYSTMFAAAREQNIAGVLGWTLWDYLPGQSRGGGIESREDYFGLLRFDGSEKPAMADFRAYAVPPLPSMTSTAIAYTEAAYDALKNVSAREYGPPLYFPETNIYVWDAFKDYWRRFGGLSTFGYPITMARKETTADGQERVVQYFERARFELHEQERTAADYSALDKAAKLRRLVKLTALGSMVAANKGFTPVPPPSAAALTADTTLTYFSETGHTLGGLFRQYWQDNNGLANFGYPISQVVQEVNPSDGKTYYVQYFERQRFEWHRELAGTAYEVQLGQLGREWLVARGCLR